MNNSQDILNDVARDVVRRVVAELGEDNVRSVFLSGSVVSGEVSGCTVDGVIEIYSDADLYVIVNDSIDIEQARAAVGRIIAAYSRTTDTYALLSAPDVGVFDEADLMQQPARPGTVDVANRREELFGQPVDVMLDGRFRADAIDPREALYLLENRLLEIGDAAAMKQTPAQERFARYVILKAGVDLVTAVLVAAGEYRTGRGSRFEAFDSGELRTRLDALMPERARPMVKACRQELDAIQAAFARDPSEFARRDPVERVIAEAWVRIARRIFGSGDPVGLMSRRVKGQSTASNLRDLLILARRAGMNRLRMSIAAAPNARFDTLALLRIAGLLDACRRHGVDDAPARRLEVALLPALERLTRLFGFDEGDVVDRARSVRRVIGYR